MGATIDIAERHGKPVIFVLNAATARARITGESAVALSQHGTVAPVTIHHRVDFAASMVDGRTVGEIMANSPSAKEITELWSYVQFRLSKLVRDPKLLPEYLPRDQSVAPLLGAIEEGTLPLDEDPTPEPPPFIVTPGYVGPDRRGGHGDGHYAGPERRSNAFGRRPALVNHHEETGALK
jgi:chromosome partitioning protein